MHHLKFKKIEKIWRNQKKTYQVPEKKNHKKSYQKNTLVKNLTFSNLLTKLKTKLKTLIYEKFKNPIIKIAINWRFE